MGGKLLHLCWGNWVGIMLGFIGFFLCHMWPIFWVFWGGRLDGLEIRWIFWDVDLWDLIAWFLMFLGFFDKNWLNLVCIWVDWWFLRFLRSASLQFYQITSSLRDFKSKTWPIFTYYPRKFVWIIKKIRISDQKYILLTKPELLSSKSS